MKAKIPNLTPRQRAQILGGPVLQPIPNAPAEVINALGGLHMLCANSPRRESMHPLDSRVKGRVQITTDGWKAYPDTLRHYQQASVLTFYTFQQRTAVEATTVCGYQPALGASLWGIKAIVGGLFPARGWLDGAAVRQRDDWRKLVPSQCARGLHA
jgi:hypothetical protein